MRHLSAIVLLGVMCCSSASAQEIWRCKARNGHSYTASQNVASDSCRRDKKAEQGQQATQRPRDMPLFCETAKPATCKSHDEDDELGSFQGIDYRISRRGASLAAVPGADVMNYDPATIWSISCSIDKMSNVATCRVAKGDLYIFFSQRDSGVVSVGDKHFPGSVTSIKVGQKRFDTSHRDGNFAQSAQILELFGKGIPITTRFMKWPYREWVHQDISPHGLPEAILIARWLLMHGKF